MNITSAAALAEPGSSSDIVTPVVSIVVVAVVVLVATNLYQRYKMRKMSRAFAKPHVFDDELTAVRERGFGLREDTSTKIR